MSKHHQLNHLGLIGIVSLAPDINNHTFVLNFITCKKLKQLLILGLDFAKTYKIGVDWYTYGTLFLRYKGKRIASTMKKKVIHAEKQQHYLKHHQQISGQEMKKTFSYSLHNYYTTLLCINNTIKASGSHGLMSKHIDRDRRECFSLD